MSIAVFCTCAAVVFSPTVDEVKKPAPSAPSSSASSSSSLPSSSSYSSSPSVLPSNVMHNLTCLRKSGARVDGCTPQNDECGRPKVINGVLEYIEI